MPAIKETFLLAEPEPKPTEKTNKNEPAQKLLDWLQRWGKDTVGVRDIRVYGPRPIRNPKIAIDAAKTLVKYGWLTPISVSAEAARAIVKRHRLPRSRSNDDKA